MVQQHAGQVIAAVVAPGDPENLGEIQQRRAVRFDTVTDIDEALKHDSTSENHNIRPVRYCKNGDLQGLKCDHSGSFWNIMPKLDRRASARHLSRMDTQNFPAWHGTTILAVRKGGQTVIAGDGQVSMGNTVVKGAARKVRTLAGGRVIAGFAGATADAFTLIERLEAKLEQYPDQLARACVDLAKEWRTDQALRKLEAMLLVADRTAIFTVTGVGDVLEPEHGVAAIGSGGSFALAAARALVDHTTLDAEQVARKSMAIAADICVFTNGNLTVETLED